MVVNVAIHIETALNRTKLLKAMAERHINNTMYRYSACIHLTGIPFDFDRQIFSWKIAKRQRS